MKPLSGTDEHDACLNKPAFEKTQRLSSLMPQYALLALLCGAGSTLFVAIVWSELPSIMRLLLLSLSLAQITLGAIGFRTWKSVWKRGDMLIVSDGFRTERLSRTDVILLVGRSGLLGKRLRVHLNRRTRFGWQFQFVPLDYFSATEALRHRTCIHTP